MKFFENGEMKRGALAAAVILLAFLSACGTQAEQPSSDPVSSYPQESSMAQSEPAARPEEESGMKQMDDGKLRVLYRYEDNLAIVFHGAEIVFRGKGPVNYFELEDGREIFSTMETDGDHCSYSVYNGDGTLLIRDLPASPSMAIGNWLFCTSNWYDVQEGCVLNLDTMEQSTFSDTSSPFSAASSAFQIDENYFGLSYYGSESGIRIYRISDLTEAGNFQNCWGYREMDLPGFISMHRYNSKTGEDFSLLYSPASGQKYEGFSHSCGNGLALLKDESGFCSVLDVTTGEILYTGNSEGNNEYQYYSDAVKIWYSFGEEYISAPCYPDTEPIHYAGFSWLEGDDYIDVERQDGSHDILDMDGKKLASITPSEGNTIYYTGYGYLCEQGTDWRESGVTLHGIDGSSVYLSRYNSLSWFQNTNNLLLGQYTIGSTYLMDLIDTDGNVVIEGLNNYYTYTSDPSGVIFVRKGFSYGIMDMDGNWLWKESIFQSAQDETGLYY